MTGFFSARWRGVVPLRQLFLHDMLVVGTTLNIVAAFCALLLFSYDAPTVLAATVFFSLFPYNLFLVAAVWKSAELQPSYLRKLARAAAILWFVVMTVI